MPRSAAIDVDPNVHAKRADVHVLLASRPNCVVRESLPPHRPSERVHAPRRDRREELLAALGLRHARSDTEYPDPVQAELDGRGPGRADDGVLRRDVIRDPGPNVKARVDRSRVNLPESMGRHFSSRNRSFTPRLRN